MGEDGPLEVISASTTILSIFFILPGLIGSLPDPGPFGILTSFLIFFVTFYTWCMVRQCLRYIADFCALSFVFSFSSLDGVSTFFFALAAFCASLVLIASPQARRDVYRAVTSDAPSEEWRDAAVFASGGPALISSLLLILGFRGIYTILVAIVSWLLVSCMVKSHLGRDGCKSETSCQVVTDEVMANEDGHNTASPLAPKKTDPPPASAALASDVAAQRMLDDALPLLFFALFCALIYSISHSQNSLDVLVTLLWTAALAVTLGLILTTLGSWAGLSIAAVIIAAALTASLLIVESPTVEMTLWSSLAWLGTFLLIRLMLKRQRKTSSLLFILARNATQFTLVFVAATVTAMLLPILLRHVPLSSVLTWRNRLRELKEHMDTVKLSSMAGLGLVLALVVLRRGLPQWHPGGRLERVARIWNRGSDWLKLHPIVGASLERVWKAGDRGSDWLKGLAFALTALFCFSFTGSLQGNALETLQTEIKDFDKVYDRLVWQVYLDLSAELNIHAYNEAWEQLPQDAKAMVRMEIDLNKAAVGIPSAYFGLQVSTSPPVKDQFLNSEEVISHQKGSDESTKTSWLPVLAEDVPASFLKSQALPAATPQSVVQSMLEARLLKAASEPPTWMDGIGGEAVNKFLEFIFDSDHLEFIKQLSAKYPLTGDLLDVVSKSVQERVSNQVAEAAERVTRKRMQDPASSLAKLIQEEVSSLGVVPDIFQAIPRMRKMESALRDRKAEVDAANRSFHFDLQQELALETRQMESAKDLLERVLDALGFVSDRQPDNDEAMPVSLDSLMTVRKRTRRYQDLLGGFVRSSNPSKQAALIQILGPEHYRAMIVLPSRAGPNLRESVPGAEPGLESQPRRTLEGGHLGSEPAVPEPDIHPPVESTPHAVGPI